MRCYDSCSTASCKAGDSNTNTRKTGGHDILGDQPVSAEKEVGGKMGKSVARGEWGGCHKRRAQGCKEGHPSLDLHQKEKPIISGFENQ